MKLREIVSVIFVVVCLYQKSNFDIYKNIWEGSSWHIPEELLDYTVGIIGVKRKGVLDIELRKGDSDCGK